MAIVDTPNQNLFGTNYNAEEEERRKAELAAQGAMMGAGTLPDLDSNVVATVPGIENIRNPGAFDPTSIEPVEPVGPPTTVGESISQTYNESVLADLINKGFGQEAFQSQAPDGTPTFSIFNKRFGTLGSQVPYSEASPEAKQQAMNFMIGTGGQERPLPETPTSPVRSPEQVQSILDEQRAAQAAQAASALGTTQFPSLDPLDTPSETVGQIPSVNAFSAENAGQVNPMMEAQSLEATQGEATVTPPTQTLSQFMRYEDAPEQRTEQFVDAQGRLRFRPTQEALRLQAQGEVAQPPVDSAVPSATTQPPVNALSSFEQDSLARQQRIGGTGSFEGDSEAREARLRENERRPGESQADRDTRVAQSKTTGGQTGGLSFDDARRRAEGQLAERGVRNPRPSQVNALARALQAGEPERLAELETKRAKDAAELRDAEAKKDFKPQIVEIGDQRLIQLAPEYYQPIRPEPKEDEPFEPRILEHNGFIYFEKKLNEFERQPATGQTREDMLKIIQQEEQAEKIMGAALPDGNAEGDKKLDKETAQAILNEAGGDREEARRIARERGFVL